MPDKTANSPQARQTGAGSRKRGVWRRMVNAVAFISVVVLVEVVTAAVLIPSAQDTEATARRLQASKQGDSLSTEEDPSATSLATPDQPMLEVELGQHNITRYNPQTDKSLIVDLELYGLIFEEDKEHFYELFENNKVRIREQVMVTLGSAETADLTHAQLGLIKRRILEKSNRALGRPLLQDILFSKFNFVER